MGPLLSSFQSSLQAGSPFAYALAFLGGLLVSFTPCVYPILPVTVGYIGSRSGGSRRHAFLLSAAYAVGMALTYAALGMAAGLSGSVFGGGFMIMFLPSKDVRIGSRNSKSCSNRGETSCNQPRRGRNRSCPLRS